jgi:hypothetical protein
MPTAAPAPWASGSWRRSVRSAGHLGARLGATTAARSTALHPLVPGLFASVRAVLTDLGTDAAGPRMKRRLPQHEVRRRLADLRAIEEQADVLLRRVLASLLQTVLCRSGTRRVAIDAVGDAPLQEIATPPTAERSSGVCRSVMRHDMPSKKMRCRAISSRSPPPSMSGIRQGGCGLLKTPAVCRAAGSV